MEAFKKDKIYYLEKLRRHLEYYNKMAPFPVYDTDYVDNINKEIENMKYTKEEYNNEPVEFCSHCKSLHIENDEKGNAICHRCGAVNEVDSLHIDKYNEKYEKIWE